MSEDKEKKNNAKKIDEEWKKSLDKEKDIEGIKEESDHTYMTPPKADFGLLISSLMLQALIFLGEIENPVTKVKEEEDLPHARYIIDTIAMLKDKTKGNLAPEESQAIESVLFELQSKFVAKMDNIGK